MKSLTEGLEIIRNAIAQKSGGIFMVYADYLHCDAGLVYVVRNNAVLNPDATRTPLSHEWKNEAENVMANNPDLPLYIVNMGHGTFTNRWSERVWDNTDIVEKMGAEIFNVEF